MKLIPISIRITPTARGRLVRTSFVSRDGTASGELEFFANDPEAPNLPAIIYAFNAHEEIEVREEWFHGPENIKTPASDFHQAGPEEYMRIPPEKPDLIPDCPVSIPIPPANQPPALFVGGVAHDYQLLMDHRRPAKYGIPVGIYGGMHSYSRVGDTNLYLFMGVE